MNRRLLFLFGHLSGLLVGAALVWIYCSNGPISKTNPRWAPPHAVVLPVSYPSDSRAPHFRQLPEGWELRFFNGQPYYVIPLEREGPHEKI